MEFYHLSITQTCGYVLCSIYPKIKIIKENTLFGCYIFIFTILLGIIIEQIFSGSCKISDGINYFLIKKASYTDI